MGRCSNRGVGCLGVGDGFIVGRIASSNCPRVGELGSGSIGLERSRAWAWTTTPHAMAIAANLGNARRNTKNQPPARSATRLRPAIIHWFGKELLKRCTLQAVAKMQRAACRGRSRCCKVRVDPEDQLALASFSFTIFWSAGLPSIVQPLPDSLAVKAVPRQHP